MLPRSFDDLEARIKADVQAVDAESTNHPGGVYNTDQWWGALRVRLIDDLTSTGTGPRIQQPGNPGNVWNAGQKVHDWVTTTWQQIKDAIHPRASHSWYPGTLVFLTIAGIVILGFLWKRFRPA